VTVEKPAQLEPITQPDRTRTLSDRFCAATVGLLDAAMCIPDQRLPVPPPHLGNALAKGMKMARSFRDRAAQAQYFWCAKP
jgi:hypothetical protein